MPCRTRLVTADGRFRLPPAGAVERTERLDRVLGRERSFWRILAAGLRAGVLGSVLYRRHVNTGPYSNHIDRVTAQLL